MVSSNFTCLADVQTSTSFLFWTLQ